MKETTLSFDEVARLPSVVDNCAVAARTLGAGTRLRAARSVYQLDYTVLEGHRFATRFIEAGAPLLSWGLPFGYALTDIDPGNYVCNQGTLEELQHRNLEVSMPREPNFRDYSEPYVIDEKTFVPGRQIAAGDQSGSFDGFLRDAGRGAGTRNFIVLLGTNSRAGSFARRLAELLKGAAEQFPSLDGIVAISHTEGAALERPHNLNHVLRTLAGFAVHPNVGAVLILDDGPAWIDNRQLQNFMESEGYPLIGVHHFFLSLSGSFQQDLDRGRAIAESWIDQVGSLQRTACPVSELKVALQCGGSDSFSGITSNPLLGLVAREILRHGGSANLAETNELVGAESYVLSSVRDLKTAYQFLLKINDFKTMMKWHGHTPEQNPSGGNRLRGLYNIALKSIGAAQKRHPEVRLDYVIEYSERMREPGYYFMNSPGNDLESIAGQVAAGSNLVFFSTGNGSITNFPFVPTVKVMSTTRRYRLMPSDMDVNAGAILDGTPIAALGTEMFAKALEIASGQASAGERAGHSQVSIWRDWKRSGSDPQVKLQLDKPSGKPFTVSSSRERTWKSSSISNLGERRRLGRTGLVLPNSLCSSEVARLLASRLNAGLEPDSTLSNVVSLSHTEGCGAVRGPSQDLLVRTLIRYMTHPLVGPCLLVEHGCENVHHQYLRQQLDCLDIDADQFGWVSLQLDGGIDQALEKAETWFKTQSPVRQSGDVHPGHPIFGLALSAHPPPDVRETLISLVRILLQKRASVVAPQIDSLKTCLEGLGLKTRNLEPSLAFAAKLEMQGLHVLETPGQHWVEILTGLGAAGAELILAYTPDRPLQGHPLVPVLQFSVSEGSDFDLVLANPPSTWHEQLIGIIEKTLAGEYIPAAIRNGNTDFQVPRGPHGFSV